MSELLRLHYYLTDYGRFEDKNAKKEIKTKNNQKYHQILQKIKIAPGMISILNFPDIISAKVHVFLFDEQFFKLKCPSDEPCSTLMFVNAVVFMLLQSANEGKMNYLVFSFNQLFGIFFC
jgi:hypothetical protein